MPKYILLMSMTDQGAKDIENAPVRIEEGIRAWEAMGGKTLGFYTVMGEYDYVAIGEASNDDVVLSFVAGLAADGNVRTKTLKAFTKEEFAEAAKKRA